MAANPFLQSSASNGLPHMLHVAPPYLCEREEGREKERERESESISYIYIYVLEREREKTRKD